MVNVVEMPIKCPVAPLEFLFLADEYFTSRGIRDRGRAGLRHAARRRLHQADRLSRPGHLLEEKGIEVETEFNAGEVDGERAGPALLRRARDPLRPAGDASRPTWAPRSSRTPGWATSSASCRPTSTRCSAKAARRHLRARRRHRPADLQGRLGGALPGRGGGREPAARDRRARAWLEGFDGHANCFIESGYGKALLIDFNYDVEPLPGRYPAAGGRPDVRCSRRAAATTGASWRSAGSTGTPCCPAVPLPVPNRMSMVGKTDAWPPEPRASTRHQTKGDSNMPIVRATHGQTSRGQRRGLPGRQRAVDAGGRRGDRRRGRHRPADREALAGDHLLPRGRRPAKASPPACAASPSCRASA